MSIEFQYIIAQHRDKAFSKTQMVSFNDSSEHLAFLQEQVGGGTIELLPLDDDTSMVVNENGRHLKLARNQAASERIGFDVYGPALIAPNDCL